MKNNIEFDKQPKMWYIGTREKGKKGWKKINGKKFCVKI